MNDDIVRCREIHYGDTSLRPDIHGILIPGSRGRLLSVLYTAGGPGPHPTVLLLHGIPGSERNFDLAHALRRSGFHVMIFHYSGSWGSDGSYSLAHNLEDADTVLDYLLADHTYGIDKERVYAVGHSLGGFVCGQLTARRPEIRAGALLMPCDIGRIQRITEEDPLAGECIFQVLEESAQWLNGTSGPALLQEAEANSEYFCLESLAGTLAQKPILCVAGTLDDCTPLEQHCMPLVKAVEAVGGRSLKFISYPTDHFFSDYRLTVTNTVIEYLHSL